MADITVMLDNRLNWLSFLSLTRNFILHPIITTNDFVKENMTPVQTQINISKTSGTKFFYFLVRKICQNTGFLWPVFLRIRIESKILSLYGKMWIRENPNSGVSRKIELIFRRKLRITFPYHINELPWSY